MHVSEKVDINLDPSGFAMIIGSCAKPDVYTRPPAPAMPGPEAPLYPRANTSPGGEFQETGPHQPSVYPMRHKRFCA